MRVGLLWFLQHKQVKPERTWAWAGMRMGTPTRPSRGVMSEPPEPLSRTSEPA